jgi:poly(3-hydroxybutyrate) depolymerase
MANRHMPPAPLLTKLVAGASDHHGPWPSLSVWQGDADRIVAPANVTHIVDQWRGLSGLSAAPDRVERIGRHTHSVWHGAGGRIAIERYDIVGMDHGVPLDPGGPDGCGMAGPYMLDAGISSTAIIARTWGLTNAAPRNPPARHGFATLFEDVARAIGLTR